MRRQRLLYLQSLIRSSVENYVNIWCNYGFTFDALREISAYCFKQGKNSFEDMDGFINNLYENGVVAESAVTEYFAVVFNLFRVKFSVFI